MVEFAPWNDAYADAMREVYASHHSDDLDACLSVCRGADEPHALGAVEPAVRSTCRRGGYHGGPFGVLENGLRQAGWRLADHPGLLHMYIHLVEMSPHPEYAASPWRRACWSLVPDAGHLMHMPTHIDVLCGDYQNVVSRNHIGHRGRPQVPGTEYYGSRRFLHPIYRCHNYHFKIYGAMFLGQPSARRWTPRTS